MGSLTGRRILITGAASGIGATTAKLFAQEGCKLALLDRNREALEAISAELGAYASVIDISDEKAVGLAVEDCANALGGLDGTVNAAGIAIMNRVEETTFELWRAVIDINLGGTFLVCRAAIPFLKRSSGSTIVNIASASGLMPSGAGAAYGASKAGVDMLTKYLAKELAPAVRVNSVCPGTVDTPMMTAMMPDRQQVEAAMKVTYALQRAAQPKEIAAAILFLTSGQSSYVTGISLPVDGGRTFH